MKNNFLISLIVFSLCFLGILIYTDISSATVKYTVGTDTITVTNGTITTPITFTDIYNADVSGSWGQVTRTGTTQFYLNCNLLIGDGTYTTWLSTKDEEIIVTGTFRWSNKGNFRSGNIDSLGYTSNGSMVNCRVSAVGGATSFGNYNMVSGYCEAYFYDSKLLVPLTRIVFGSSINSNFTAIDCQIETEDFAIYGKGSIFKNCYITEMTGQGLGARTTFNNPLENIIIAKSSRSFHFYSTYDSTLINCKVVNPSSSYDFKIESFSGTAHCKNVESRWLFNYVGTSTGKIYRDYSFNITVCDIDGIPLEDALINIVSTDVLEYTNANGKLDSDYWLSMGYYSQTYGNTLQANDKYTMTIYKEGYIKYQTRFYMNNTINTIYILYPKELDKNILITTVNDNILFNCYSYGQINFNNCNTSNFNGSGNDNNWSTFEELPLTPSPLIQPYIYFNYTIPINCDGIYLFVKTACGNETIYVSELYPNFNEYDIIHFYVVLYYEDINELAYNIGVLSSTGGIILYSGVSTINKFYEESVMFEQSYNTVHTPLRIRLLNNLSFYEIFYPFPYFNNHNNFVNATGTIEENIYLDMEDSYFNVWGNVTGNSSNCSNNTYWFNYSDENITINISVHPDNSSVNLTYGILESAWLYLGSTLTVNDSQFYLLILVSLWAFFIFMYEEKKNNIYAFCIIFLGIPLGLIVSGIAFFNSYPFGYLISFIIILISFLIPTYSSYKNNQSKKK